MQDLTKNDVFDQSLSRFNHEEKSYIFSNVLEMVFCRRVFQSLPQESLQHFSPDIKNQAYAGLGRDFRQQTYQAICLSSQYYTYVEGYEIRLEQPDML